MNVAQHINYCYTTKNKPELLRVKKELDKNLSELDSFFEEYLEVFDEQLNATSDREAPVWKAYNDYYKSYQNIKHSLKMTDYYLGMI